MRIYIVNWSRTSFPGSGGAEKFIDSLILHSRFGTPILLTPPPSSTSFLRKFFHFFRYHLIGFKELKEALSNATSSDIFIEVINTVPFFVPYRRRFRKTSPRFITLIFQTVERVWFFESPILIAFFGKYFFEPLVYRLYRNFPAITISKSTYERLIHFGLRNISVAPVGVDKYNLDIDPTLISRRLDVVFCARLVNMKRPQDAISAFLRACEGSVEMKNSTLHVIGDGPLKKMLIDNYGNFSNILFHGYLEEKDKLNIFKKARCIVSTSVVEGWGLTISEGAACAALPIVYDVPGLRDSARSVEGIIVKPNPESMALALRSAFKNNHIPKAPIDIAKGSDTFWQLVFDVSK